MKRLFSLAAFSLIVTLLLALPSGAHARRNDNKPHTPLPPAYEKVAEVDVQNLSIGILDRTGKKTTTYRVTSFTKIMVNGKAAKLADIKKDMKVSVSSSDGKTATRIDADDPPKGAAELKEAK